MAKENPEQEVIYCPNCMKPAIKIGNEITCDHCDATFRVTKIKENELKEIRISDRLTALEKAVFPSSADEETEDEEQPPADSNAEVEARPETEPVEEKKPSQEGW